MAKRKVNRDAPAERVESGSVATPPVVPDVEWPTTPPPPPTPATRFELDRLAERFAVPASLVEHAAAQQWPLAAAEAAFAAFVRDGRYVAAGGGFAWGED